MTSTQIGGRYLNNALSASSGVQWWSRSGEHGI